MEGEECEATHTLPTSVQVLEEIKENKNNLVLADLNHSKTTPKNSLLLQLSVTLHGRRSKMNQNNI